MFSFKHRWIADILVLSLLVYFGVNAFITVLNSRLAPTPAMQEQAVKLSEKPAADAGPTVTRQHDHRCSRRGRLVDDLFGDVRAVTRGFVVHSRIPGPRVAG